jgi:UDP-2,4-diacetamido-2,4,6-trideoxy-beta-L-altropyranose hydrolase
MSFLPEAQGLKFTNFEPDQKYDLIVVDNYSLLESDYLRLYNQTDKILALDDLCNRNLGCDFLWDPTLTRKKEEYEGHVPDRCKLYLGGQYQIFSDQHIEMALLYDEKQRLSSDTVHLYGGQTQKLDLSMLCMSLSRKFKVSVLGDLNNEVLRISKNITITKTSMNPIETFWNCKLGVGSPGNMLWERGSIGIPSYVIMNNPNQEKICTELNRAGLLVLGHYDQKSNLIEEVDKIQSLFNDREKLEMISQKLRSTICLMGKRLLVREILQEL